MFKLDYGMESYIVKLQKTNGILLTKLRTLNNKLPVSVGRHHGVSREERLCNKCDAGGVGQRFSNFTIRRTPTHDESQLRTPN